jgi:hypothetical protein
VEAFTANLRQVLAPPMAEHGFAFDGTRVFRRPVTGSCVQLIDVQLGDRFMQGKFTINLGIYDPERYATQVDPMRAREHDCQPDRRQRLGLLLPSRWRPLARLPRIGLFFGPKDIWWPARGTSGLERAREALIAYGLPWLERHTPGSPR